MSSSKTQDAGDDGQSGPIMSDELVGVIDPHDLYGDGDAEADIVTMSSGDTGRPRRHSNFRCMVTLDDDQVISGDVLSFQMRHGHHTVKFMSTMRYADDICTREKVNVRMLSPSGIEVFNVNINDGSDVVDIEFNITQLGPILTLSFDTSGDS